MSSTRDAAHVLSATAEQAHRLLGPDATVILVPSADGGGLRPAVARGIALGPIADIVVEASASARFATRRRQGRRRRPHRGGCGRPRA